MPISLPFSLPLSLDTKIKKIVAVAVGVSIIMLLLGVWIGYKAGHTTGRTSCYLFTGLKNTCARRPYKVWGSKATPASSYFFRSLKNYKTSVCLPKTTSCHNERLPRNYIAYYLDGKNITIDGQDTDQAWTEVPWSKPFQDMRASWLPKPRFVTKFKMRWDDTKMYVLIYVQEKDLFGTHTINDTSIWLDNGVEMLMDVDGSMFNYKQVQLNVLGAFSDQSIIKSPHDVGGDWRAVFNNSWSSGIQHAVNYSGTINNPSDKDKYWKAEMSFTWAALAVNTSRATPKPKDNEVWFMQFGRSEWKLNVTNNTYVKALTKGQWQAEDWWSWQPCGAINLHLQDRWGMVQFMKGRKKFLSLEWHVYRALFDTFNGLKKYFALNNRYTDSIYELDIPTSLLSRMCVDIPTINMTTTNNKPDFIVNVKSRLLKHVPAHIRSDRYVWFQ